MLHINSYYGKGFFYKNLFDQQVVNGLDINVYIPVPFSFENTEFDYGKYSLISKNHGKYDRALFHLKHYKIYKDIIKRYKIQDYNIIHAHSLFSNGYIAMKLKKKYNIPYIVAVRNTDVNTFFKYMFYLRRLGIRILEIADAVIFLSKTYLENVVENYVPDLLKKNIYNKSVVIPNGIDDFWFKNKGKVKSLPARNEIRILYVGTIDKNKNISTTIKAIDILREKNLNIKFTVVGKIINRRLYKLINERSFVNCISFKPKEELLKIYREHDVFVMPSKHETFGLVYAEALTQGLPIIYTKGQGFDGQFANGEVGYGVHCLDAQEIADRILDILANYTLMSVNCLSRSEKFRWDVLCKRYNQIYF